MATTQEVFELVLKTQGADEAKRFQALLDANAAKSAALAAEVDHLNNIYQNGSVQTAKYAAEMLKVEKAQDANKKSLDQVIDRYQKVAIEASGSRKNLSAGLLEFSRAAEDAQYGIRGVLNNIPGLVQQLGGGAGLAGAFSLVAVGITVLLPQLQKLWDSLGGEQARTAKDQFKEMEKTIKELSEKPLLLRVEQVQLEDARLKLAALQRGLAEWNAMQESFTARQAESGALFAETMRESAEGATALTNAVANMAIEEKIATSQTVLEANAAHAAASADVERARALAATARDAGAAAQARNQLALAQERQGKASSIEQDALAKATTEARAQTGEMFRLAKAGDQEAQIAARNAIMKTGAIQTFKELKTVSTEALKLADDEAHAQERLGDKLKASGEARRGAVAADKARQSRAEQTPEYKEFVAQRKQRGEMDEFGRQIGEAGFDEKSAAEVMRKANADIKKAKASKEKLEPMATREQAQKAFDARQKAALAQEIMMRSGGEFSPQQAQEAAGEAQKAIQTMGAMGQTQAGVNDAIALAMGAQYMAMQKLMQQFLMQQNRFQQMGNGFQQMVQPMDQNQQGFLGWGNG